MLSAIEHELVLLEALALDLSKNAGKPDHHLHVIEEDLLFLENRIAEELHILRTHDHENKNHTLAHLLEQGHMLIHAAQEVLRIEPNVKEASTLKSEMAVIEKLVKELQAKPAGADLKKDEEALARHERTLRNVLERISERNKGKGGF